MISSSSFLKYKNEGAIYGSPCIAKKLQQEQLHVCHSMYHKDLIGNFGCVNAIEFSQSGELLASGEFFSFQNIFSFYNFKYPYDNSLCLYVCLFFSSFFLDQIGLKLYTGLIRHKVQSIKKYCTCCMHNDA